MESTGRYQIVQIFLTAILILFSIVSIWFQAVIPVVIVMAFALPISDWLKTKKLNEKYQNEVLKSLKILTGKTPNLQNGPLDLSKNVKHYSDKVLVHIEKLSNDGSLKKPDKMDDDISHALYQLGVKLDRYRKEQELRSWHNRGLSKFSDLITKHNKNLQVMCEVILAQIIKYLDINQGAVYVCLNDNESIDNVVFEPVATYAYGRKKFNDQKIEGPVGLVGQAYLEREPIFMTEVPQGFVRITSGLGETTADSIFIVPLVNEEKVVAVLELASIGEMEKQHRDFVLELADNLASSIQSIRRNKETEQLLEQSLQKSEQLKQAEEELHQNIEEMHATQEDLMRKGEEFKELKEESVERFELINHGSQTALWDLRLDANLDSIKQKMWWSKQSASLLRLERLPESIKGLKQLIHPKDINAFNAEWHKLLKGQKSDNTLLMELRLVTSDGNVSWYQLSASVHMSGAKAKRVAGSLVSIQEAKDAQASIKKINHLRLMTLSSINKGAIIFDDRLRLIFANSQAEKLLGRKSDELKGLSIDDLVEMDRNFQSHEEQFSYSWTHTDNYLFNASMQIKGSENRLLEASVDELIYENEKEYILYLNESEKTLKNNGEKSRVFHQMDFIESKFQDLLAMADKDLLGITEQLSENVSRLNNLNGKTTDRDDNLIVKEMKGEFNRLIIDLQYHDALTQKIQHLQWVHNQIRNTNRYYQVLKPLLQLFICQMGSIRKEYGELSERIKASIYEIMKNKRIVEMAGLTYKEAFTNYHALLVKIDEIVRHYRIMDNTLSGMKTEQRDDKIFEEIFQMYSMDSEREVFSTVFDWEMEKGDDDIELF